MGRHSRPDEDEASVAAATVEPLGRPTPRGRHAAADENAAVEPVAGQPAPRPKPAPKQKLAGTAADLHLIRTHADVRNRCVAAILVPFVVFTAAMFAAGKTDVYLFWIAVPTIVAGILVGTILDHAHKRYPDG